MNHAVGDRWDRVFRTLAAEPRRRLVLELLDSPPEASVPLPDAVIPPGYDVSRESLAVSLQHQHLPKMEGSGYVTWGREPFEASRGPQFDEVGSVMLAIKSRADVIPPELVRGCDAFGDGL